MSKSLLFVLKSTFRPLLTVNMNRDLVVQRHDWSEQDHPQHAAKHTPILYKAYRLQLKIAIAENAKTYHG